MKNQFYIFFGMLLFIMLKPQYSICQKNPYSPLSFTLENKIDDIKQIEYASKMAYAIKTDTECKTCGGYRYGVPISSDINVLNCGSVIAFERKSIWRLQVHADSAVSMQIMCDKFNLPKGASMFLYTPDRSKILGPYCGAEKGKPIFGSRTMNSDKIIIEIDYDSNTVTDSNFHINGVVYGYNKSLNSYNSGHRCLNCEKNVECQADNFCREIRSVAEMDYTTYDRDGNWSGDWACSGFLMNNINSDFEPYFLTAEHCVNDGADLQNAIFIFNWQSPTCDPTTVGMDEMRVKGATLLVADGSLWGCPDYALLKLSRKPNIQYNVYYAGWTINNYDDNGNQLWAIHHPRADMKKISRGHIVNAWAILYDDWAIDCDRVDWESGTVEDGSSGAPLFDYRVVNGDEHLAYCIVKGGTSFGDHSQCDNTSDYTTRISDGYYYLSQWTDPPSTHHYCYGADPIGACQQNIVLDGNFYPASVYQNNNKITIQASNSITNDITKNCLFKPSSYYKLKAQDHIHLQANSTNTIDGFHVPNYYTVNAELHMRIEQCQGFEGCGFNHSSRVVHIDTSGNNSNNNNSKSIGTKAMNTPPSNIESVKMYPNPMYSKFTIEYTISKISSTDISIQDLFGREVKHISYPERTEGIYMEDINMDGLASGIYSIQMKINDGMSIYKVVKMQ